MLGSCGSPARMHGGGGGGTGSLSRRSWHSWDGASSSILSEDSPGFLRMYIRYIHICSVARSTSSNAVLENFETLGHRLNGRI